MLLNRRQVHRYGCAAVATVLSGSARSQGDPWPTRPVRIIVPFAPAGPADAMIRYLADRLTSSLGQPFVVENRPGLAGTIGMDAAAKSRPDGYTFVAATRNQTINETMQPRLPHRLLQDFTPVAGVNVFALVLAVGNAVPARSVAELIAHAKANPGLLDYASNGQGSIWHISTEVFCAMAGISMQQIPFTNYNEARTALLANRIHLMFDAASTLAPLIQAGSVRGLATTGTQRPQLLPELPLIAETLPGFEASQWAVLVGPVGVPRPIVEKLAAAVDGVLADPRTVQAQERVGGRVMPMSPEQVAAFLAADIEQSRAVIRRANIRIE